LMHEFHKGFNKLEPQSPNPTPSLGCRTPDSHRESFHIPRHQKREGYYQSHNIKRKDYIVIKNIGSPDKIVRILFAVVVAILYFANIISGTLAVVLGLIGAILLLTALVGTCPIYLVLHTSTKKVEKTA
jgi:hypothetical protein